MTKVKTSVSHRNKRMVSLLAVFTTIISTFDIGNVTRVDAVTSNEEVSEDEYQITVPTEEKDYVVMTTQSIDDGVTDEIVSGEDNFVYVSDSDTLDCHPNDVIEENIIFEANTIDNTWLSKEDADIIMENCNTDWNYDMIRACDTEESSSEKDNSSESEITTNKAPVKIAILDSGVDFVTSSANIKEAVNLVEDEQDLENMLNDMTGHGSAVASIISTIDPTAEIYSVRVLDENNRSTLSRVVAGIYWCIDKGIDIINMSFGTYSQSSILEKAINDASEHGILLVSSAGNNASRGVEYPAKFDGVVAVGSVGLDGTLSDEYAHGEEVDLLAPGENVFVESMLGMYTSVSGTSIAAPHVAAAASLLWKEDKQKSGEFIRELLVDTANMSESDDGEAGVVDVEYAQKTYDSFQEKNSCDIPVNNNDIITYEDGEVSANWGNNDDNISQHELMMKYGIEKNVNSLTKYEITALKKGAVYPDRGNLSHRYCHGRRGSNWIASYIYLTALAQRLRNSTTSLVYPTGNEVFQSGKFTSIISIIKSDITFDKVFFSESGDSKVKDNAFDDWHKNKSTSKMIDWSNNRILGECGYSSFSSSNNRVEIAMLKSLFVYGLALHDLTDTFAHAAYMDDTDDPSKIVKIIHHEGDDDDDDDDKKIKSKPGADSPDVAPWRFKDAKFASIDVVSRALKGQKGEIVDFAPHELDKKRGYYLHRILEKAYAIDGVKHDKYFKKIDFKSFT